MTPPTPDQYANHIADALRNAAHSAKHMMDQGCKTEDIHRMVGDRLRDIPSIDRALLESVVWSSVGQVVGPTEAHIRRLLAKAAAANPGQAPAIECYVLIRGLPTAFTGSLSETPEGGLRLLSVVGEPALGVVPMMEHFFDYTDVACFAARVETRVDNSPIVRLS